MPLDVGKKWYSVIRDNLFQSPDLIDYLAPLYALFVWLGIYTPAVQWTVPIADRPQVGWAEHFMHILCRWAMRRRGAGRHVEPHGAARPAAGPKCGEEKNPPSIKRVLPKSRA